MVTLLSDGYVTLSGVILSGEDTTTGVTHVMESFEGWGSPAARLSMAAKPRSHGAWVGDSYLEARSISASGVIIAETATAARTAMDALIAACSLRDTTLSVNESGTTRSLTVRRSGAVLSEWLSPREVRWSIQMLAADPRKFGTTVSGSTLLGSTSGGLSWPVTFPIAFNSTVVSGQVHLVNEGNITGPLTLRIDGPVTGPYVTHVTSGITLTFATSVVLGAGEWLEVDLERRQVLANGQSSRNGYITSRGWFGFEPGDNTFTFGATSYDAASSLTVTGRPSWQ
jgi:hypothetical protein